MEAQTVELLKECNSGCKMALNSIHQVMEYAEDEKLLDLLRAYNEKHEVIEDDISKQLAQLGKAEEEPGLMAAAMSWISTEMKMLMREDSTQIAKIIMDGCNMGIQSVSEYVNKNKLASDDSIRLAKNLIKTEEDLMEEMKKFL